MNIAQAKSVPIPEYLVREGHAPAQTRQGGRELWYCSPIRARENTPSFKVDATKNVWFDHGLGTGGTIIDLVMELYACSVRDALRHLERHDLVGTPSLAPSRHRSAPSAVRRAPPGALPAPGGSSPLQSPLPFSAPESSETTASAVNAALSPLAGFAASDTPEDGTRPPESAPRVSEGVSASSRQNVAHDRGDGAVGKTDVPAMRDVSAGEKKKQEGGRSSFEILSVGPLTHPALLQYLTIRGIDHEVARRYLSQIDFTAPERRGTYFALGYPAGEGYEARNALFKGFVGTGKSVTFHDKPGARILQVFEGVMDFLSLLTMDGETQPAGSVLVLNSTALWERALPYIDDGRYDEVRLYLDNDAAGDAATAKLFAAAKTPARLADMRAHYRGYDDLNAWLTVTTM